MNTILHRLINIAGTEHAGSVVPETETVFRLLLDSAPDAMAVSDEAGHIILANLQMYRMFGLTTQGAITMMPPRGLYSPRPPPASQAQKVCFSAELGLRSYRPCTTMTGIMLVQGRELSARTSGRFKGSWPNILTGAEPGLAKSFAAAGTGATHAAASKDMAARVGEAHV